MKPINCQQMLPRNFILKDGSLSQKEFGERRYSNNNATSEGSGKRQWRRLQYYPLPWLAAPLDLAFVFADQKEFWFCCLPSGLRKK